LRGGFLSGGFLSGGSVVGRFLAGSFGLLKSKFGMQTMRKVQDENPGTDILTLCGIPQRDKCYIEI